MAQVAIQVDGEITVGSVVRGVAQEGETVTVELHDKNGMPVTARNRITAASSLGDTQDAKSALGMSARLVGVSMIEGKTALTVTPSAFSSSARLSVKA